MVLGFTEKQEFLPSGYDIHSSPWYRWPIEIDGLAIKNGWIFHGEVLVITRGYLQNKAIFRPF